MLTELLGPGSIEDFQYHLSSLSELAPSLCGACDGLLVAHIDIYLLPIRVLYCWVVPLDPNSLNELSFSN